MNSLLTVACPSPILHIFVTNFPELKRTRSIKELRQELTRLNRNTLSMGLVPTMGSLHEGHLSLIRRSIEENAITVVSIFVNPTQFNEKQDFESYPRDLEIDLEILQEIQVDIVFSPSAEEVYPEPDTRTFDFKGLDDIMEGRYRPGHFNGVAQVVSRLFNMIGPDTAYFGEKDFQQLAIIRKMTSMLALQVRIIACPTIREADGLAMSSRNLLLSEDQRQSAARIYQALKMAREQRGRLPVAMTVQKSIEYIKEDPSLQVDYFEIVDSQNLEPVRDWNHAGGIRGCIAVRIGNVRLIDNMDFSL
jgi:pantoate--beta-alanine ligase